MAATQPEKYPLSGGYFSGTKVSEDVVSTQDSLQVVKSFFKAMGSRDTQGLLALSAEDIEWIVPGEGWSMAGTYRGHAGLRDALKKVGETIEMSYPKPPEFIAQGERVFIVGSATGKVIATNKPFKDDWIFDITVRNGKLTKIQEYINTQALVAASTGENA